VKNILAQTRTRSAPAATFAALAALFFSTALAVARADDLPPPLTLNIPVPANLATPAWLGHPVEPDTDTLSTLELPITPPSATAALLVTVYFTETDNGFLRVNWIPNAGVPMALASNFYEGVSMANSRSLLIPPSTLGAGGTLVLQGTAAALGVQRVEFEWLESRQDLVAPNTGAMLVTNSGGTTVTADSVNGQPETAGTGTWNGEIVSVPVTSDPERIEQGVEFTVQLDNVPVTARLALKESGLSLSQHIVVWVNEARAGTLTPAVPGLGDAGYFTSATGSTTFVGWRNGSFFVPVSMLKQGENTLQFSPEADNAPAPAATPDTSSPLAIKDLVMQMNYTPPAQPAPAELPPLHLSVAPELSPATNATSTTTSP
jgi:hypothetical protein